jgi:hypothetical protein
MTDEPNNSGIAHSGNVAKGEEEKNMKLSRKAKLGLLSVVLIAAVAIPVYAWIASNVVHLTTILSTVPFSLTSDPLPSHMYSEGPVVLNTTTQNLDGLAYTNVRTNYRIWRDSGPMLTTYVTAHIKDVYYDLDLTFTVDGGGNLVATLGPYATPANFNLSTNVTVTLHSVAPLDTYHMDMWISVG